MGTALGFFVVDVFNFRSHFFDGILSETSQTREKKNASSTVLVFDEEEETKNMDPFSMAMNPQRGEDMDVTEEERMEYSETRMPDGSTTRRAIRERIESIEPRAPVHVHFVGCRAPPDEERLQRRIGMQARDAFDPEGPCTLCTIPDRAGKHVPDNVTRVYDYMEESASMFPGRVSNMLIARRINSELVAADRATGGTLMLPHTTESEVEYHLNEETLHLPGNEIRMLTVLLGRSLRRLEYLEDSHLFLEKVENGERTGEVDSNWKGQNVHKKEIATVLRLMSERAKMINAKEKRTIATGKKKDVQTFASFYESKEY